MTEIDNARFLEAAERGWIYEFLEADGTTNKYVLVVSSQKRANDRMISILMLGDSCAGYDVVRVGFEGGNKYLHCGMVTYTARTRLGKKMYKVAKKTMENVDFLIADNLGLNREKMAVYKDLYEELLRKVMGE